MCCEGCVVWFVGYWKVNCVVCCVLWWGCGVDFVGVVLVFVVVDGFGLDWVCGGVLGFCDIVGWYGVGWGGVCVIVGLGYVVVVCVFVVVYWLLWFDVFVGLVLVVLCFV